MLLILLFGSQQDQEYPKIKKDQREWDGQDWVDPETKETIPKNMMKSPRPMISPPLSTLNTGDELALLFSFSRSDSDDLIVNCSIPPLQSDQYRIIPGNLFHLEVWLFTV